MHSSSVGTFSSTSSSEIIEDENYKIQVNGINNSRLQNYARQDTTMKNTPEVFPSLKPKKKNRGKRMTKVIPSFSSNLLNLNNATPNKPGNNESVYERSGLGNFNNKTFKRSKSDPKVFRKMNTQKFKLKTSSDEGGKNFCKYFDTCRIKRMLKSCFE